MLSRLLNTSLYLGGAPIYWIYRKVTGKIEYIDEMLMNMDVKKVYSLENIGLLSLDQYYIDRFERIIEK